MTFQYGIRFNGHTDMTFSEFNRLIIGLGGETPLGHVMRIRGEKDPKEQKRWNSSERRIFREWQEFTNELIKTDKRYEHIWNRQIEQLQKSFAAQFTKDGV